MMRVGVELWLPRGAGRGRTVMTVLGRQGWELRWETPWLSERRALDREGRREEGCCKTQAFVFVQICIQMPSPTSSLP